ncbi:MAG: hypothetical protein DRI36_00875 [Caldiserica bacterium]|nr:MAG: hypothetical protein DRI36_00875 [Caldisericota bacterium]
MANRKREKIVWENCPIFQLISQKLRKKEISEVTAHLSQAKREILLAIRSAIDSAIGKETNNKRIEKIKVK